MRIGSFDNMQVLKFNEFGLKMPIHAPNTEVLGIIVDPQRTAHCIETCHTTNRSLTSVQPFLHSLPFYPTPRILRFAVGHTLP